MEPSVSASARRFPRPRARAPRFPATRPPAHARFTHARASRTIQDSLYKNIVIRTVETVENFCNVRHNRKQAKKKARHMARDFLWKTLLKTIYHGRDPTVAQTTRRRDDARRHARPRYPPKIKRDGHHDDARRHAKTRDKATWQGRERSPDTPAPTTTHNTTRQRNILTTNDTDTRRRRIKRATAPWRMSDNVSYVKLPPPDGDTTPARKTLISPHTSERRY